MATKSLKDYFKQGYNACISKNGIDPIPNLLPATDNYRSYMTGWNKGLEELKLEHNRKEL